MMTGGRLIGSGVSIGPAGGEASRGETSRHLRLQPWNGHEVEVALGRRSGTVGPRWRSR